MSAFINSIIAPVISLFIMVIGNGLLVTLSSLRIRLDGYSTEWAGYLIAAYYAGLILGALQINKLIEGVGHIRAFSAFGALITSLTMLQGLFVNPITWVIIRFFIGLCIAGIFITVESWLLVKSPAKARGRALSFYMITNYAAQGTGQFFLNMTDPKTLYPFCFIIILSSLSIIPLSLTKTRAPIIEEPSILSPLKLLRYSPLGVIGAMLSGVVLGSVFGLLPVYAQDLQFSVYNISLIMGITIFGGLFFQWPIGIISDHVDRRKLLLVTALITLILSLFMGIINLMQIEIFLILCFIFGGFCFVLYPLSVSHACDIINHKDLVAATGGLLLAYGVGAIIGPILSAYTMKKIGPDGFFYFITCITFILALFTAYRVYSKIPVPKDEKLPFSNLPRTTPMASELDPRAEKSDNDQSDI